jgi:hypothetical protein
MQLIAASSQLKKTKAMANHCFRESFTVHDESCGVGIFGFS